MIRMINSVAGGAIRKAARVWPVLTLLVFLLCLTDPEAAGQYVGTSRPPGRQELADSLAAKLDTGMASILRAEMRDSAAPVAGDSSDVIRLEFSRADSAKIDTAAIRAGNNVTLGRHFSGGKLDSLVISSSGSAASAARIYRLTIGPDSGSTWVYPQDDSTFAGLLQTALDSAYKLAGSIASTAYYNGVTVKIAEGIYSINDTIFAPDTSLWPSWTTVTYTYPAIRAVVIEGLGPGTVFNFVRAASNDSINGYFLDTTTGRWYNLTFRDLTLNNPGNSSYGPFRINYGSPNVTFERVNFGTWYLQPGSVGAPTNCANLFVGGNGKNVDATGDLAFNWNFINCNFTRVKAVNLNFGDITLTGCRLNAVNSVDGFRLWGDTADTVRVVLNNCEIFNENGTIATKPFLMDNQLAFVNYNGGRWCSSTKTNGAGLLYDGYLACNSVLFYVADNSATGVYWTPTIQNGTKAGVRFNGCTFQGVQAWVGVGGDAGEHGAIVNCSFIGPGSNAYVGGDYKIVANNIFQGSTTGVTIVAGCDSTVVANNTFTSVGTKISDSGANTLKSNNVGQ